MAPPPSPPGPHTPGRHDERGMGTFNWPPAGTCTWPHTGTFSWPRTLVMAEMCRTDGSAAAARCARDASGHAVRATPPGARPTPLQLPHEVRDRCGHILVNRLLICRNQRASRSQRCRKPLPEPPHVPGERPRTSRPAHREQPRISRMTAPERLRLNHCSTTPGKTRATQLSTATRPQLFDLAKLRSA